MEQVRNYMHAATLLMHTSLAEGLSTALLEAIVCGLPFVATPAGGSSHIVQESGAGVIVPYNDEKALSEIVSSLLSNMDEIDAMKKRAHAFAPNLSWDRVFPRIMEVYRCCTG
jgi:glycosyltransferase involved in cell wall biosynthesis